MTSRGQSVPSQDGVEAGSGALCAVGYLGQVCQVGGDLALVQGDEDRVQVREVLVQRCAADAALLGDLRHGHAGQAVLGDQGSGGIQGGLAYGVAVRCDGFGPDSRHLARITL